MTSVLLGNKVRVAPAGLSRALRLGKGGRQLVMRD